MRVLSYLLLTLLSMAYATEASKPERLSPEKWDAIRYWTQCSVEISRLAGSQYTLENIKSCDNQILTSNGTLSKPKTVRRTEITFLPLTENSKYPIRGGYIVNIELTSKKWLSIIGIRDETSMRIVPYVIDGKVLKP